MAIPIAQLPSHERPRERLWLRGIEALSERELLALVLRQGTAGASALELADALLAEYGGLSRIANARPEELARRSGIGPAKAASVVAAFRLGHLARDEERSENFLQRAEDVAMVARQHLTGLRRERVIVLVCNTSHRLQRVVTVSDGAVDRALFPVREIFNAVLRHDGKAFAVAHNHPSGDPTPSTADYRATDALRAGATTLGLRYLDHIVIAGESWVSAGEQTHG